MEPPIKPDEADCCNTGCKPCILDVYDEQLRKYKAGLLKLDLLNKNNCISPAVYTVFKLTRLKSINGDTAIYTFQYEKPYRGTASSVDNLRLSFKPGQHFLLRGNNRVDHFTKAYTPIPTKDEQPLSFTVLIKLYDGGIMSQYIRKLKLGQETVWRGPYGDYKISYDFSNILFIAQGTGIAPVYSVIDNILNNENCDSILKLFYCCRNESNICLRDNLHNLKAYWNFEYEVFLSNTTDNVTVKYNEIIHRSRINIDYLQKYLINKDFSSMHIVICGSDSFNGDIKQFVLHLNFPECNVFVF